MEEKVMKKRLILAVALVLVLSALAPGLSFAQDNVHVVQRGETLSKIARQHGTSVQVLVNLNGISNPSLIYVGQRIRLPGGSSGGSSGGYTGSSGGGRHTVQYGDTLYSIAIANGTSIAAIQGANGLGNSTIIRVGQTLVVPSGTGGQTYTGGSVAPAGSSGGGKYIVQPGDTCSGIAYNHGTTCAAIASASGLRDPNLLRVGQRLVIPGPNNSSGQPPPTHQTLNNVCSPPSSLNPINSLDRDPGFRVKCLYGGTFATPFTGTLGGAIDQSYFGTKFYQVPGCQVYGANVSPRPDGSKLITCWLAWSQ